MYRNDMLNCLLFSAWSNANRDDPPIDSATVIASATDVTATDERSVIASSTSVDHVFNSSRNSQAITHVSMTDGVTPDGSGSSDSQTWSTAEGAVTGVSETKMQSTITGNGDNEQPITQSSKLIHLIISNVTPTLATGSETTGGQTAERPSTVDNSVTEIAHLSRDHNDEPVTQRSTGALQQVS
jgi:hypothetical protein